MICFYSLRLPFAADHLKQLCGLGELAGDSLDRLSYSHCQLFILLSEYPWCFYQLCSWSSGLRSTCHSPFLIMTCDKLRMQIFDYKNRLTVPFLHCFVALFCIGEVPVAYLMHKEAAQAQAKGLHVSHTCTILVSGNTDTTNLAIPFNWGKLRQGEN